MIREGGDLPKTYTQIAREIMYKGGTKGWNVRVAPGFMPRSGTKVVAVGGQVRKPGLVDLNTGLTLWEAVNRAGGATQWASMRKVNVIRDGWERRFNLTSLKWTSFPLQDGDVVEVMFKDFMGDGGSPKHAWD